jgi:hypothetical protein
MVWFPLHRYIWEIIEGRSLAARVVLAVVIVVRASSVPYRETVTLVKRFADVPSGRVPTFRKWYLASNSRGDQKCVLCDCIWAVLD